MQVELGANWIQRIDNRTAETRNKHPIWALSHRCFPGGLQGQFTDYSNVVVYNEQQENVTVRAALTKANLTAALLKLPGIVKKRMKMQELDISVRQGLNEVKWNRSSYLQQWVEWFNFDYCYGESANVTSLYDNVDDIKDRNEGSAMFVDYFVTDQRGYASLVQCLANDFMRDSSRDSRLHLNANVSRIEWSDECVCVVAHENMQMKRYCARYAILTFGIGVLKSKIVEFVPNLPREKTDAINSFDLVSYLKIFLEFDKIFWERDTSYQYIGHVSSRRGDYPIFHPLNKVLKNNPKLILATLIEGIADETVYQSESEIKAKVTKALRSIYGENNVEEPVDMIVPDWIINPLFRGMYTNSLVGTTDSTYTELAKPLGRLYFSGGAVNINASGYVHGAYYAGIDSANAIAEHMTLTSATPNLVSSGLLVFTLLLS